MVIHSARTGDGIGGGRAINITVILNCKTICAARSAIAPWRLPASRSFPCNSEKRMLDTPKILILIVGATLNLVFAKEVARFVEKHPFVGVPKGFRFSDDLREIRIPSIVLLIIGILLLSVRALNAWL